MATAPSEMIAKENEKVELNRQFYHGMLPRCDVEPLLKDDGDFLLRKTDRNGTMILVLSVKWEPKVLHFIVNRDEKGLYYIESIKAKTIHELISQYLSTEAPLSAQSQAKLYKGIPHEPWILDGEHITLRRKLGEGAFGNVYSARYGINDSVQKVAVKVLHQEITRVARLRFMKEARIMRKLSHKNIIKFIGVVVYENPLIIVMELCKGGSLVKYLRTHKKLDLSLKLRFCFEACSGLAYLESKGCIHRDIAARNCLLSKLLEVKICDFGMADERKIIYERKLDKVPMKWLAPETMQMRVFSSKTDVWSYGVMVWEIYSNGREPYYGMTNMQTRAQIVVNNYRMTMPEDTPKEMSEVVYSCWNAISAKRPTFETILEKISTMMANESRSLSTTIPAK